MKRAWSEKCWTHGGRLGATLTRHKVHKKMASVKGIAANFRSRTAAGHCARALVLAAAGAWLNAAALCAHAQTGKYWQAQYEEVRAILSDLGLAK